MTDTNDYDYDRYVELILAILNNGCDIEEDPEYLEVGENISGMPQIKVIFDGFADKELEDENGNYVETIEQGDKNSRSYAIFVDHRSGDPDFEFPEHDFHPLALIHRPSQEVCIYAWYDAEADIWDVLPLEDRLSDSPFSCQQIMEVLEKVVDNNDLSLSTDPFPFPTTRPEDTVKSPAAWPFATAPSITPTPEITDEDITIEEPPALQEPTQDYRGIMERVVAAHGLPKEVGAKGWISETQNFHYNNKPFATVEEGLKGWMFIDRDDDGDGEPSYKNVDELLEVCRAMIEDSNDDETSLVVNVINPGPDDWETRSVSINNEEADGKSWDYEIEIDEDEFWEIITTKLIETGELDEPEEDEEIDHDDIDVSGFLWEHASDMGGEQRYSFGYGVAYMEFDDGFKVGMTAKNGELYIHYYDGQDVNKNTVFA